MIVVMSLAGFSFGTTTGVSEFMGTDESSISEIPLISHGTYKGSFRSSCDIPRYKTYEGNTINIDTFYEAIYNKNTGAIASGRALYSIPKAGDSIWNGDLVKVKGVNLDSYSTKIKGSKITFTCNVTVVVDYYKGTSYVGEPVYTKEYPVVLTKTITPDME